jgi:hypothetical protein
MNYEFELFEFGLLVLNILLFIGSKFLFNYFYKDNLENAKPRVKVALILTGSLLVLQLSHIFLSLNNYSSDFNDIVLKLAYSISVFYSILIAQALVHFILKVKFGSETVIDGKKVSTETHVSRMLSILLLFVSIFLAIYINIQIWSAASLMETTGIVGLTLGALALTNGVWFPDIHRGLIALKVKSFEVGDVIKLDNRDDEYIVYSTSLSNLTLLNIRDNHRMFLWNHQLSSTGIHNLTKVAGSLGLRKTFVYKIGYPQFNSFEKHPDDKSEKNANQLLIENFIEKVRKTASDAYQESLKQELHIKEEEFSIRVLNTGDYAIEFVMSFYIERIPRTTVTKTVRKYLIDTPLKVNENMLIMAYKHGLDLSTPTIYQKID